MGIFGEKKELYISAESVEETTDGGYIVAGSTFSFGAGGDVYLLKTDSEGDIIWEKTFGEEGDHIGSSVQETRDGGYIVLGAAFGSTGGYAYLLKLAPERVPDTFFVRGDVDADGRRNIADAVLLLRHVVFGARSLPCGKGGDANDNGELEIADAVYLLNFLFRRGPPPPDPFPDCGPDSTEDDLPCTEYPACS